MPSEKPKFYLTTPIYYVNARPHIGHAYTTIVADVLARRHRLLGEETFFLTGTDEHGQKIERSAAAAGIPPQQFTDQVAQEFKTLWDRMGITYDKFIRTTDPAHKLGVQKLWRELEARGFIYLSSYTGSYCVSDEAFVDAPAGTPCPDCGRLLETVTEENYFFKLSEFQLPLLDLIESDKLTIENAARRNEVLSFLRGNLSPVLDEFMTSSNRPGIPGTYSSEDIAACIETGKLKKTAHGLPYVPGAVKDLSISRSSFKWGIPVPGNDKHVIYVWLDALANYITALGYGSDDTTNFEKFWPADLHLVGKEIIRFHCVYWPAFLLAAGLPIPKAITAHGWLLFDNSKMSKSKGNIVRTETILSAFGTLCPPAPISESTDRRGMASAVPSQLPDEKTALAAEVSLVTPHDRDLFASDVLRYFLLREIPFGQDGSFSFDALLTRYNADLANGYGNLVSRTLNMIHQYFNGEYQILDTNVVFSIARSHNPAGCLVYWGPPKSVANLKSLPDSDPAAKEWQDADSLPTAVSKLLGKRDFTRALELLSIAITSTDVFLSGNAPWKLAKESAKKAELKETLMRAAESIRIITLLLHPIMPYATTRVWAQLGLDPAELTTYNSQLTTWGGLRPGTKLGPLSPIFPRADKSLIEIMTNMEEQSAPTTAPTPEAPAAPTSAPAPSLTTENGQPTTSSISIDDFAKIELRVAQIVVAERIPKADKLLRLEVDLGPDFPRRQILSGIAEWYTPEELIGRRIVVITNLAPRKMRGLESHGMLLAASHGENGKPILATFAEDIALGSRLK